MAMKRTHKDTPLDVGRLQFSASMYKETMVEKLTDNKEENEEEIPSRENWKRYYVNDLKADFCSWIDYNIEHEYQSYPEFFIKEGEKRFYMGIIEEGASDDDPEDEWYCCIFVPFDTKQVEEV